VAFSWLELAVTPDNGEEGQKIADCSETEQPSKTFSYSKIDLLEEESFNNSSHQSMNSICFDNVQAPPLQLLCY